MESGWISAGEQRFVPGDTKRRRYTARKSAKLVEKEYLRLSGKMSVRQDEGIEEQEEEQLANRPKSCEEITTRLCVNGGEI